jgi:hypothetical protein
MTWTSQKPAKPLWDQEKSCWEGPFFANYFKHGFWGVKVSDFPSEMGLRSRGQPGKPEINARI